MDFNNPSTLDSDGREVLDQTPVAIGVHFERPVPLHIRIRQQLLQLMEEQSATEETFQDADDFNVEDDDTLATPYEMEDDFDHIISAPVGGAGGYPPSNGQPNENEATAEPGPEASEE